jgi:hypothetical protein
MVRRAKRRCADTCGVLDRGDHADREDEDGTDSEGERQPLGPVKEVPPLLAHRLEHFGHRWGGGTRTMQLAQPRPGTP